MPRRVCMALRPSVITLYPTCTRKDWGACSKDVERGYGTSPPQPGPAMATHTTPRYSAPKTRCQPYDAIEQLQQKTALLAVSWLIQSG